MFAIDFDAGNQNPTMVMLEIGGVTFELGDVDEAFPGLYGLVGGYHSQV